MSNVNAEDLFVAFLEKCESGVAADFEALVEEHPGHARDLRELRADWERVAGVLGRLQTGVSFDRRLEARLGTEFQSISLEGESEPSARLRGLLRELGRRRQAFGRYRLKDVVGQGGMGVVVRVWDSDLKRHLAMKLQRDVPAEPSKTPQGRSPRAYRSIGRFLEEAQVTGQLEHPGIVPVHELGLDSEGNVYFTMRLVRGEDFGRVLERVFAGEPGWTQTRALGALSKACEALAYAHAKGVIHRDLKPANIMVGRFGEVYVMDWGLARVLGSDRDDAAGAVVSDRSAETGDPSPLRTSEGDVVGTPSYMSPEQARGELQAMGPRSDVYSLGAILYHLLTGVRPYGDGDPAGALSTWQKVREGAPTSIASIDARQPPELVAICEKAMARAPEQRYKNVEELAMDLGAFLEQRVVQAYRTGPVTEFKKWVTRNKPLAATAAAAVVLIAGGSTATAAVLAKKNATISSARIEAESERRNALDAQARAEKDAQIARSESISADRVAAFLESLVQSSDPWQRDTTDIPDARELLRAGVARMGDSLDADPVVRARLAAVLATSLVAVGALEEALPLAEEAYELRLEHLGPRHSDTIDAQIDLAAHLPLRAEYQRAESLVRDARQFLTETRGARDLAALRATRTLGEVLVPAGRFYDAVPLLREARAGLRDTLGPTSQSYLAATEELAAALFRAGKYEEADECLLECLINALERHPVEHPSVLLLQTRRAAHLTAMGAFDEAEQLLLGALVGMRKVVDEGHRRVITTKNTLANLYIYQERYSEAMPLLRECLDANIDKYGPDHEYSIVAKHNLGIAYSNVGEFEAAEALVREALDSAVEVFGPMSPVALRGTHGLGEVLYERAAASNDAALYDQCEALYLEALAAKSEVFGEDSAEAMTTLHNLCALYRRTRQFEKCSQYVARCYATRRARYGPDDSRVSTIRNIMLHTYHALGRWDEVMELVLEMERESGADADAVSELEGRLDEMRDRLGAGR